MTRMTRTVRTTLTLCAVALALAALASPAAAETYTLELHDGKTFESSYAPQEASWDAGTILFLSSSGNWVGVPRADVAGITIATEFEGRGQLIDQTTIFMGFGANDLPGPGDAQPSEVDRLINALQNQGGQGNQNYSTQQFVEPDAVGTGIPVGFTQQNTPQLTPPATTGGGAIIPVPVVGEGN